jgi:Flp pilus assembly CpaE family ATPase
VVVDSWSALDDFALAILDASRRVVIVTTPQVTALRDTHRFLEVIKLLNYNSDKCMLVVNNCYQRSDLKVKEVERILGKPIVQTIEYTPGQVNAALNRGMALVQEYQASQAAQDIFELARLVCHQIGGERPAQRVEAEPIAEEKPQPAQKRGLFSRRT